MSWSELQFKEFVTLQRGFDLPKSQMETGDVPVLGSNSVIGFHNVAKVEGPGVVTGRSGSLGQVQYVEQPYWPHNTALWVKDFKGNNPRFVYYKLKTLNLERFNGGVSVPTLNRNVLDLLRIRVPRLREQTRIASILSAYDDLIENNQRRIRLLERSARLLYREWFVLFRFPGHERVRVIDGLPEGWERKSALDVMDVMGGGTPKTNIVSFWNGKIPFFTSKDSTDYAYVFSTERTLTEEGLCSCNGRLYPKDTVFFTARGTVGKINLAQTDMAMNQSCYALVSRPPLNQHFLYFATKENIEQFRNRAVGAIFDAIIRDTFKMIPFVVSHSELIDRFTDVVSPILRQIDILSTEIRKLVKARDIILPRLMAGIKEM